MLEFWPNSPTLPCHVPCRGEGRDLAQDAQTIDAELVRRHKSAVTFVLLVLALTLLLMLLSFTGAVRVSLSRNPLIEGVLRIAIAVFGLGAIVLRRTKFAAIRLQDIAALKGPGALLETLHRTTMQVALLAAAIALMGFVLSLYDVSENDRWLGIVAIAVLLYAYPRRAAWQRVLQTTRQATADEQPAVKGTTA